MTAFGVLFCFLCHTAIAYPTSYITPTCSGACCNDYMTAVITSGGTSNFTYTASSNTANYHDYHTSYNVSATQGTTISVQVQREPTYTVSGNIWIDWNQNGTFESSEQVNSSYAALPSSGYYTFSFTVPTTAVVGTTCMRVGCVHPTATLTSTFASWYGEFIDFQFTVQAGVSVSNTSPAAANVPQGTFNSVLQTYNLSVSGGAVNLTGLTVITAGTYVSSDVDALKCWYSTSSTFSTSTATLLSTLLAPGTAGTKVFTPFTSQTLPVGTGYIFITADVSNIATVGNNINLSAIPLSDFVLSSAYVTGSDAASSSQTFIAGTNCSGTPNAGTATPSFVSVCGSGSPTLFDSGLSSGSGITYQWSSSSTNTPPGTAITGATSPTYIPTVSATTYFWCTTTCSFSSLSNISTAGTVSVNPVPTVSAPTGPTSVYVGTGILLTDTTIGTTGYFSSGNTAVATADTFGDVFGVAAGTVNIYYNLVSPTGCVGTSSPISVTVIGSPYCSPTVTSSGDAVGFSTSGGITNVPTGSSYGATYTNASATTGITTTPGATINYTIKNNTASYSGTGYVWADWNISHTFADSSLEFILSGSSLGAGGGAHSGTFTVPVTARGGISHFRAAFYETASTSPCSGSGYGASVDFYMKVLPTITLGSTPTACLGGTAVQTISALTGSASSYQIVWNSAALAAGFENVPNTTLTSASSLNIAVPSSLTGFSGTTTYSGTIYVSCAGGTTSQGTPISVTVSSTGTATPITGTDTVCQGGTVSLSNASTGGTWSTASTSIATITSGGVVSGVTAGTTTVSYNYTGSCGSLTATQVVTVSPLPNPGTIAGPDSVCIGSTITLTDSITGGSWSLSNADATVLAGAVTGVATGSDSVIYTVTNGCGAAAAIALVTINALPVAGTISGPDSVCAGSSVTLTDSVSGGVWTVTNTNATVVSGTVTGTVAGTDSVLYTVSNGCGTSTTYTIVTINPLPNAGSITGIDSLCVGAATTLTASISGGSWSVSNTNAAVTSGIVSGTSTGVDTVLYTVTNGCGTATASVAVTVATVPVVAAISGSFSLCQGSIGTFTDSATGGTWMMSNTNASVVPVVAGSAVTGTLSGTDSLIYTITNLCGSANVSAVITINPLPASGGISGTAVFCAGTSVTLTDTSAGGVWTVSNASATATGDIITGVLGGTDTVIYTYTNSCGTATALFPITVNPLPNPSVISGTLSVCPGGIITLTDTATGGVWNVSNTNASISGGVVTGLTAGTDTVSYAVTNGCGTQYATAIVTVNPMPDAGSISGTDSVCQGASILLTASVPGGTYSVTNINASVDTGVVSGLTAGIDTVVYTVTNSCGIAVTQFIISINPAPATGTITGTDTICAGASVTVVSSVSGGAWTASNSNATVTSGNILGMTSGADTISYSVTNSCGTAIAMFPVTVNPAPNAGSISGATAVCPTATITLSETVTGGSWSAVNSNATVAAAVVTGVVAGIDTITYSYTNSCGTAVAVATVSVNYSPNAGVIIGTDTVCQGAMVTFTDTVTGIVWSASNTNATVAGGIVTGNIAGTDTVTATITNTCGTASVSRIVTVNPLPVAGTISGADTVCQFAAITLSETEPGGVWTSVNTAATVSAGVVSGANPAVDTIKYTVANGCGAAVAVLPITVHPAPNAGIISGTGPLCTGSTITLTDAYTGGTWSASNAAVSIAVSGTSLAVTGSTLGTDTISYSFSNSCGTAIATTEVSVNPAAIAGTISGTAIVCQTATVTLTATVTGGTWSTIHGRGSVSSIGVVTGVNPGLDSVKYTVTNSCGTAIAYYPITVSPLPAVSPISGGSTNICVYTTTTYTDTASGGSWSTAIGLAGISSIGVVSAGAPGTDTVVYTVTNSCGTNRAVKLINIMPLPYSGTITGPNTVCAGSVITITDTVGGGTWHLSNANATLVGSILTGMMPGQDTISYTVITSCGVASARKTITVNPLPVAASIVGMDNICIGTPITLIDTASGGTWSVANTHATVVSGVISGISAGSDTVLYAVTNACGTVAAEKVITVTALPIAGTITGASDVCEGSSITVDDSVSVGVWASGSAASIASIPGGAVVSGAISGWDTVTFSVTNLCGTAVTNKIISVHPLPATGVISGSGMVCASGGTITLTDTVSGGYWSASATYATVAAIVPVSSGMSLVTGVNAGVDTIFYTTSNACGTAKVRKTVTVNPLPVSGTVTGVASLCSGLTATLSSSGMAGGVWSSLDTSKAIVSDSGFVAAGIAGTDTVYYSYTNMCGTSTTEYVLTVLPLADAGTITGPAMVCVNATDTLNDMVTAGSWSSMAGLTAVTSGIVTGLNAGIDTILYVYSNSCGTASTRLILTVNPLPNAGTVTGADSICVASTVTLNDSVAGGSWLAYHGKVSIDTFGTLSGIAVGWDTVVYLYTNMCGTDTAMKPVHVLTIPDAGSIHTATGIAEVCSGSSLALNDSVAGGVWTTTNGHLTVTGNMITGVTLGTDTVRYTVTGYCGAGVAQLSIDVVSALAPPSISGIRYACVGRTPDTLSGTPSGGIWSVTNANASVSSGVVVAINQGYDTVWYKTGNACGTDSSLFVVIIPTAHECDSINAVPDMNTVGAAIKIFPNPATGKFTVALENNTSNGIIRVVDIYGKLVANITIAGGNRTEEIMTTGWVPGTYMVIVRVGEQIYREKLVVTGE
jgi:GEVED domain/Secretion system C-terminal sorting domain